MNRERWCRNCRGWHRDGQWPRECYEALYKGHRVESPLPIPFVRRDHMDTLQHPADGRFYESRSDYESVTKAHPNLIEVGTEKQVDTRFSDSTSAKDDVMKAISMVEQGYKPSAETGKEGWTDLMGPDA